MNVNSNERELETYVIKLSLIISICDIEFSIAPNENVSSKATQCT